MSLSTSGSALVTGVKASRLGMIVSGDVAESMNRTSSCARIGGRLSASEGDQEFSPSCLDRHLHEGLSAITIPLASVEVFKAVKEGAPGAIVIDLEGGLLRFRCNGSGKAAEELSRIAEETTGSRQVMLCDGY